MFKFIYNNLEVSHKLGVASYPSDNYSRHVHYQYELIFIIKGNLDYTVDGESHTLKEGDFVLVHPGQIHFANINGNKTYERFVLKFEDSILPKFLNDKLLKLGNFFNKKSQYSIVMKDFDNYYNNFKSNEEKYALFTSNIIKLCVYLSNDKNSSYVNNDSFVKEILNYIDEHIGEDITLETLSKTFMFSKSYISTVFKNNTRTTIMKYIRTKKIIYAHKLILNGEKKSTAATLAGFDEYSTFYRSYLKLFGKKK